MDVIKIIEKYYEPDSKAYYFLIHHSKLVAKKALQVAERVKELNPNFKFIEEAAMLHDIGIFMTHAPKIGCYGFHPYISHCYLGREIVEKEKSVQEIREIIAKFGNDKLKQFDEWIEFFKEPV